jgi:hypothetical protein
MLKKVLNLFSASDNDNESKIKKLEKFLLWDISFKERVINIYLVNKENMVFWKWLIATNSFWKIIRQKKIEGVDKHPIQEFCLRIEKEGVFEKKVCVRL